MDITCLKEINESREVQNAISSQKEVNVITLFRNNLRDQALHHQQLINIKQFMDRLKISFGITGNIFDSYAELKKLCVKNQENYSKL